MKLIDTLPSLSDEELNSLSKAVYTEHSTRLQKKYDQAVENGLSTLTDEEKRFLEDGELIRGVAAIRARCHLDLKEAKTIADRYYERYRKAVALW